MAFVGDITTFKTGTGIAGTTIDVPVDLGGETPKVVWVYLIGRTDIVDANGASTLDFSYGFGTDSTHRACIGGSIAGAAATTATTRIHSITHIAYVNQGRLNISNLSADNVRLVVDTAFASDLTGILVAASGDDLTNSTVVNTTKSTSTTPGATQDINFGFNVRYVECINSALTSDSNVGFGPSMGRFDRTAANMSIAHGSLNSSGSASSASYQRAGEFLTAMSGSSAMFLRAAASLISNGIRLTYAENDSTARRVSFLALGGTFAVKSGVENTLDTATSVVVDTGWVPKLGCVSSHCRAESTSDTVTATSEFSMGWWTGQFGAKQLAAGWIDPAGADPTATATWIALVSGVIYNNLDTSGAIEGSMQVESVGDPHPTSISFKMLDADPTPAQFQWVMFGDAVAAIGGNVAVPRSLVHRAYARFAD